MILLGIFSLSLVVKVREKERFKPNPYNYAMKKTQLMKERDSALGRGDDELAREINQQLQELEERASELDKMRTSTISSISYINDRNRKRNVEEAEKAIMEEIRANKGKKVRSKQTKLNLSYVVVCVLGGRSFYEEIDETEDEFQGGRRR